MRATATQHLLAAGVAALRAAPARPYGCGLTGAPSDHELVNLGTDQDRHADPPQQGEIDHHAESAP